MRYGAIPDGPLVDSEGVIKKLNVSCYNFPLTLKVKFTNQVKKALKILQIKNFGISLI